MIRATIEGPFQLGETWLHGRLEVQGSLAPGTEGDPRFIWHSVDAWLADRDGVLRCLELEHPDDIGQEMEATKAMVEASNQRSLF